MNYIQLVAPNLATVGNIGWCLSFVENVFGTPHVGDTATDAWYSTLFQHKDRNFPAGMYVPIWFKYFETDPKTGQLVNYGHVAVLAPDGRVLSSPYAQENTHVWFDSIDQCAQVLNCTYLGWSEDLAGVQIIKEDDMFEKGDAENIIPDLTGRAIDEGGYGYVGQSFHDAIYGILGSPSFKDYVGQIPQLQAQLTQLQKEYDDLKVLKAQEQATPDVPPVPVVINDPLPPQPVPPNIPSGLSTPLKVAIGAIIALLVALAAWIH